MQYDIVYTSTQLKPLNIPGIIKLNYSSTLILNKFSETAIRLSVLNKIVYL